MSVIWDARDMAGSTVTPRFFAKTEGDMVIKVMAGREEGVGLSSSTSVLLSFNLHLLVATQSWILAMQSWMVWMDRGLWRGQRGQRTGRVRCCWHRHGTQGYTSEQ